MEKKIKTQNELPLEINKKKDYLSPTLHVTLVEMECGIAANSAAVTPVTVGGDTSQVPTDWNGNDDTTIHTPF
ncbi:TPA: hypothetical protein ACGZ9U_001680 [Elizabethkingia anophelis]